VGITAAASATVQESVPLSSNEMDGDADQTFIWGTNLSGTRWHSDRTSFLHAVNAALLFSFGLVAVSRVQARFNAFIRTFKENAADADYKYMQLLQEVGCMFALPQTANLAVFIAFVLIALFKPNADAVPR
jgi:hypothetical protein